jgi:hypothetical protein
MWKNVDFRESCLPAAPKLLIINNEKFGTFSLCKQLSDKLSGLPIGATYRIRDLCASRPSGEFSHLLTAADGPMRRFAAARQDACNGSRSGLSADVAGTAGLTPSRRPA